MSKDKEDKDEKDSKSWSYDGSEDGWDTFDRKMIRYMSRKYDTIGEKIWLGTTQDIAMMEGQEYIDYCTEVWHAVNANDSTLAWKLWTQDVGFREKPWQNNWIRRQLKLMRDYVEDHSTGQMELEMINYTGPDWGLRKHLFKQFGSGSGGDIHEKELEYDRGMVPMGQPAFPRGCDMVEKLRQLENRRLYFNKMCAEDKKNTYPYCKETKLVRIVVDHTMNGEYSNCISRVLDLVKMTRMINSSVLEEEIDVDDIPDTHERSFNDDWLPSWKLLKQSLIIEYKKKKIAIESKGAKGNKAGEKIPVAAIGFVAKGIVCYACGGPHKKGDPVCKAGAFDVHESAPKEFKEKQEAKKRKYGGNGKEKGKGAGPRNPNKKQRGNDKEKKHCTFFNFGKGTCRYGAKCRFEHEDRTGGREKKGNNFNPAQQKLIATMVATAVKKSNTSMLKSMKKLKDAKEKKSVNASDDESGDDMAEMMASFFLAPITNTIPRNQIVSKTTVMATNLHNIKKNCGIDTDAGMSVSTVRGDFPWFEESNGSSSDFPTPAGISGGNSRVKGMGPMIIRAKNGEYLIDPEAIFIEPSEQQPNFRVMSAQRLKAHGVRLVQCFNNTENDVLQDRKTHHIVELSEEGPKDKKILVLETVPCDLRHKRVMLKVICDDIKRGNTTALITHLDFGYGEAIDDKNRSDTLMASSKNKGPTTTLMFNEAKVSDEERSRLYVRRLGYCNSDLFKRMTSDSDFGVLPKLVPLNEDSPINDAAKFRKKTHKRIPTSISMGRPCWWRAYVDGYGGGNSMGAESYEGAIGGYLFVCSSTGDVHHKLYASHEQFPAAMFQFLTHVESEGYRCHEVYCDTFSVNLSAELEEVMALFQAKIVPVSSGTPEEVSFVESAHRVIAARSRAMMLGAPHLPSWC